QINVTTKNETIVVAVTDTREGIPTKHLPPVFDRFYWGEKARSREAGGSGFGFSIARGVVQMQGGKNELPKTPHHRTNAHLSLPIVNCIQNSKQRESNDK